MPLVKKSLLVLLLIGLIAAGGTYYGMSSNQEPETLPPVTSESREEASKRTEIAVYVTGAVVEPGVVYLQQGARGGDAVKACGGFLPEAAVDQVNLTMVLKDGQQLRVPVKAAPGTGAVGNENPGGAPSGQSGLTSNVSASRAAVSGGALVNINTADVKQLDTLPGVGPSMAQRIIEYREANGGFSVPEDLKKVRGIGDAKFQKLQDKICI